MRKIILKLCVFLLSVFSIFFIVVIADAIVFDLKSKSVVKNWQVVEIEGYGTIKFPKEWECVKENGSIHLLKNGKLAVVKPVKINDSNYYDKYNGFYQYIECVSSSVIHDVYTGTCSILLNGEHIQKRYISINDYPPDFDFFVWDDSISDKEILYIGRSFKNLNYYGYEYNYDTEEWVKTE